MPAPVDRSAWRIAPSASVASPAEVQTSVIELDLAGVQLGNDVAGHVADVLEHRGR